VEIRCRRRDTKPPCLWTETELILYLNNSVNEAAEKAKLFLDSVTPAVCQIPIFAADPDPDYLLDTRILKIVSAKLSSQSRPLERKKKAELDRWNPNWRNVTPGNPGWFLTDFSEGYLTLHRSLMATQPYP